MGCSSTQMVNLPGSLDQASCTVENNGLANLRNLLTAADTVPHAPQLSAYFSPSSLQVAHIIGTSHLLHQYAKGLQQEQQMPSLENRLRLLECRQRISYQLNVASLEILSVVSKLDCEEERAAQVAEYIKHKESIREKKLTVGAIVVTAASAILTGVLINKEKAADRIGIAGGLIGAGLGVAVFTGNKKVLFSHANNPLGDIWYGPASSTFFPPVIWNYLTQPAADTAQYASVRNRVIANWQSLDHLAMPTDAKTLSKEIKLFFGVSGVYNAEELLHRASMLDQLEAAVSLMKQDINMLAREVEMLSQQNN